jgi:hypothetical protein
MHCGKGGGIRGRRGGGRKGKLCIDGSYCISTV